MLSQSVNTLILLTALFPFSSSLLSCKNVVGEDIDWWTGYKLGTNAKPNDIFNPSNTMAYFDSTSKHDWTWDVIPDDEKNSAL